MSIPRAWKLMKPMLWSVSSQQHLGQFGAIEQPLLLGYRLHMLTYQSIVINCITNRSPLHLSPMNVSWGCCARP